MIALARTAQVKCGCTTPCSQRYKDRAEQPNCFASVLRVSWCVMR